MSVLVKGIRMPKNCSLCFLRDSIHNYCPYEANKETDCPLVEVVELTDECIERIADAVVRKMTKRVCETCKHHEWLAFGKPYTYCTEDKSKDPERVDRYFTCERWEKE